MKTFLAILIASLPTLASADHIWLRPSAQVEGNAVLLEDIADLDGPHAASLGGVRVMNLGATAQSARVDLDTVRRALDAHAADWGRLRLSGPIRVQIERSGPAPKAPTADTPAASTENPKPIIEVVAGATGTPARTVSAGIVEWIAAQHDPGQRLRVRLDQLDPVFGNLPIDGRRLKLRAAVTQRLGRLTLDARLLAPDKQVARGRVVIFVEAQKDVLLTTARMRRGDTFTAADLKRQTRWIDSDLGQPMSDASKVVGRELGVSIDAGRPVLAAALRRPVLVRRGDLVTVRAYSGDLSIETRARARSNGMLDGMVDLENEKSRKRFKARVTGPREASIIIGANGAPDKEVQR